MELLLCYKTLKSAGWNHKEKEQEQRCKVSSELLIVKDAVKKLKSQSPDQLGNN